MTKGTFDKNNFAFIDSQNVNLGVRSQKWTLDFGRFRVFLRDKYRVAKAYLFIGFVPGNERLYQSLQESGYILIFKPTLERKVGNKVVIKGNVDAELVLHTMIEYPNYEKAVIASGDGDFHCLIEYLEQQDKLLKVLVPNAHYSHLLRRFRSYIINIGQSRNKLEKKTKKKRGINLRTKP